MLGQIISVDWKMSKIRLVSDYEIVRQGQTVKCVRIMYVIV